ncbi:uncharacterized protein TNIN_463131 [Trichonephila inaurata madagascariensis]|uniref:Ig-like domain-containing protein n=1 Tax=Trichonephila inaurata madagascariensis TaxID=2747483 RepID=A0A8X7BPE7_9ARAC|nr:uncharacterized protein TNIN_463131 [Trichonephila inaurata madagascariensis]
MHNEGFKYVWVLIDYGTAEIGERILIIVSNAVEIRRLSVPRWIQNGTEDFVVLDCEYVYNENDIRLVVKWFFEDYLEPVYQWIPELNNRHTSGVLKNRLDLDFAVNTKDAYSRFRALRIQKPSTELSGKYTCLVTSLAGQDSREQVMTVFVPANEFDLSYTELSDSSVNVTCEAQGLFPPPILKLYLGSSAGSPPQLVTDAISHFKPKYSGAYDAYLYRTFSASELAKNGASSVFECSLELPGTNYAKAKRIAYYPGSIAPTHMSYFSAPADMRKNVQKRTPSVAG